MSQTKAQLLDTLIASLLPASDSSVDIGSNAVRFANIYGDTLYGDGSNLTGITSTTINSNADNRLITGSGSANTLNGESELTYSSPQLKLLSTSTAPQIRINSAADDAAATRFTFGRATANNNFVNGSSAGDSAITFGTNLLFGVQTAEKMRIDSSGNVGIGTSSPLAVLHINDSANNGEGTLKIGGNTNSTTTGATFFYEISGSTFLRIKNLYRSNGSNGNNANIEYDAGFHNFLTGTGGTERMRIDSSGRLLLGTTSARSPQGITAALQVEGTDAGTSSFSLIRNSANQHSPNLIFNKTRGTSIGSATVVQNNDALGMIAWVAGDGTDSVSTAARITGAVDGTPGSNDMPGRLEFLTTADGAATPTERMRITSDGKVGIGTSSPQRNLEVIGQLGVGNTTNAHWYVDRNNSNGRFELYQSNSTANDGRKLNMTTDGQLEVGEVETEAGRGRMAIKAKNDDGGTAVNLYLQEVSGGEGYGIGVDAAGDLNFYNSGATTPSFEVGDDNNVTVTNGNLIMGTSGKGISFAATGGPTNGTDSSELLDDYEEGSWTPAVATGTASGVGNARYVKIGRVVHVEGGVSNFSDQTSSTHIEITGFPFALTFIENAKFTCSLSRVTQQSTGYGAIVDMLHNTSTAFPGLQSNSASTGTSIRHQDLNHNAASIIFSGTYTTN